MARKGHCDSFGQMCLGPDIRSLIETTISSSSCADRDLLFEVLLDCHLRINPVVAKEGTMAEIGPISTVWFAEL